MKEVNDTLGDLQLLGVSHDVPLPELVLVGDQSSGKSSLMSALARLNLPTSSGICTRCPFHIHMRPSRDSHWSVSNMQQRLSVILIIFDDSIVSSQDRCLRGICVLYEFLKVRDQDENH